MLRRLRAIRRDDLGFTIIELLAAVGGLGLLTAAGVVVAHAL